MKNTEAPPPPTPSRTKRAYIQVTAMTQEQCVFCARREMLEQIASASSLVTLSVNL